MGKFDSMKKILEVPYHSQIDEVERAEWKEHSCGIACLKMVFDYTGAIGGSIDDLIDEGVLIGGHVDGKWSHASLVALARNYDLSAYAQEFRSVSVDVENKEFNPSIFEHLHVARGIRKIQKSIDSELPAIVSVLPGFGANQTGHLVLVVGYVADEKGDITHFIIHDPDTRGMRREAQEIPLDTFKKFWRKSALFFER